jgi:pimeloyl-ACP methyl ester carboxylesterase
LMRTIAYILLCKYRKQPDFGYLLKRMSSFISQLDKEDEFDEVLVIGHSYGAVLGVEVMAHLLEIDPEIGRRRASVAYISLAGIIGLAHANDLDPEFKESVLKLGTQNQVDWIDLGARADGACSSMLDPFFAADIELSAPHYPRLFPVRFFNCFSKDGYKKLLKNKFEFHFQYLKTGEFLGEYDFFNIVLGSQGLDSVYPRSEEHPPSPASRKAHS